jgi:hypothetical protein
MIDNYYNDITNELVAEYGQDILSKNNPKPEISIRRAYELLNEMGFENAQAYVKAGGR